MRFITSQYNRVFISNRLRFIIITCLLIIGYRFIPHVHYQKTALTVNINSSNKSGSTIDMVTRARTLVIYVYGKTHPAAKQNLAFFIRTAVRPSQNADYYFILQQIDNKVFDETKLPILPSNAHYVQHENKCVDIGTIGWFLSSRRIDKTKYKYFIFLNSSVRGPFIVSYYDSPIWYTIFTRRLNDHVQLVGCTINCAVSPHVQSYLWTMDSRALDFLLKNSIVFTCHADIDDTILNAEVAASEILLRSGFGIGCLMTKYRDVDFRYDTEKKCVDMLDPTYQNFANGITLDPYEVVFVKAKAGKPQYEDNLKRVNVYEKWTH